VIIGEGELTWMRHPQFATSWRLPKITTRSIISRHH
jgi:hypothetical protein